MTDIHDKEWNEPAVMDLISGKVKESLSLEYKRCGALVSTDSARAEISKDVSAFANSAGGVLIYGVIEDNYLPTGLDTGFDPADVTREWLENIITSTIHPRIHGVVISQVELSTTHPGRVLYVVTIPQSGTAHQASGFRYYKRHNFKNQPMEDYEIRDTMNRAQAPVLQVYARRVTCAGDGAGHVRLQVSLRNRGQVIAKYASCVCQMLTSTYLWHTAGVATQSTWRDDEDNGNQIICLAPAPGCVIYPDLPYNVGYVEWAPDLALAAPLPSNIEVKITVYAEDMTSQAVVIPVPTGIPVSYTYPVDESA